MTEAPTPMADLYAALAAAQAEIKSPKRNKEVEVATKKGGKYKFSYATLDSVIDDMREALTKNGLWFIQHITEGGLVTVVTHKSGGSQEFSIPMPEHRGTPQEFGSLLTYFRRYALCCIFGIAAEEDDDANQAMGQEVSVVSHTGGNVTMAKKSFKEFTSEIEACEDIDQLEGFLAQDKSIKLTERYQEVIPEWFHGGGDVPSLAERIDRKRKQLEKAANDDTFPGDLPPPEDVVRAG